MRKHWHQLIMWLFQKHFMEEWTDAIHPEIGWYWREDEDGGKSLEAARVAGFSDGFEAGRGSSKITAVESEYERKVRTGQ